MVARPLTRHRGGMPTAIITGASRGLGLELARALAARGWRLVVDARGAADLRAAAADLAPHADVTALPGDVADPAHRRALVAAAGPRLDALVNNPSGPARAPRPSVAAAAPDALAGVLAVHAIAPLALPQAALPVLVPGGGIVNVTSDAAVEPYPGWGIYG